MAENPFGEGRDPVGTPMSRRTMLRSTAGAFLLAATGGEVLSACGGGGGGAGGGGGSLVINSFGGTFQDAIQRTVVDPFEAQENANVRVVTATSSAALTKLKQSKGSPSLGVAYMDPGVLYQARFAGLLQKLDMTKIPNAKDLYSLAVDPEGYWVAELLAMTGIAYNTEKLPDPPTSWNDLWDPKYRGHLALPDIAQTAGYQFLVMAAMLNGGSVDNIQPGFDAIKRVKSSVVSFYETPDALSTLLTSGEAWLGPWYNDRFNALKKAGAPVGFVRPKEGAIAIVSAMCLPAGSKNASLAFKYMDFQISPPVQSKFGTTMAEGFTNKRVQVPASMHGVVIPKGAAEIRNLVNVDNKKIAQRLPDWITRWHSEISS